MAASAFLSCWVLGSQGLQLSAVQGQVGSLVALSDSNIQVLEISTNL
jgi:hypothetical protein